MKITICCVLTIMASISLIGIAHSGYIVTNATITNVANIDSSQDKFVIKTNGGTGACANSYIAFPITSSFNQKTMDRAFALAVTAMTAGYTVDVYNYSDDSCTGASFIEIRK